MAYKEQGESSHKDNNTMRASSSLYGYFNNCFALHRGDTAVSPAHLSTFEYLFKLLR